MGCSNRTTYDYSAKGYVPKCTCGWTYQRVYSSSQTAGLVTHAHLYSQPVPQDLHDLGETPAERLTRIYQERLREERQRKIIEQEELEVVREEAAYLLDLFRKD